MPAPKYSITIECGSMRITRNLESTLGDVEGLDQELARIQKENGFKSLAEALVSKYGGLDRAKKRWFDEYIVLIGICDLCGGDLDHECKITENAADSVDIVCKSCVSKSVV